MRLKAATTIAFIFGMLLLACWPLFVGSPPHRGASKAVQAAFAVRSGSYVIVLIVTFFAMTVFAWLHYRRIREEYREQTLKNLKELVEGTLRDHERKQK